MEREGKTLLSSRQEEVKKSFAIWLTGTPASGKSTIAGILNNKLKKRGFKVQVLESDELRKVLTPNPTYSEEERETFYNIIALLGKILVEQEINVIFDATANKRKYREKARAQIDRFYEIYVKCPSEVCMDRDPKGLYRDARSGKISTLPGIQTGYEPPEDPVVIIMSDCEKPEEAAERIIKTIL